MSNKGKKKQGKVVMSLSEFHAATESSSSGGGGASLGGGSGIGVVPASVGQTVRINWADEMEKLDDSAPTDFVFDRSKLPTAAKSNLAPDFDLESVPKQPPFTAFISNVSFEADETKIRGFFRESNILNVRLPLDERGRFKGQGYIDFADRESLITALQRNEESFFNRAMKVVLESKSRHYGGRGGANDTGERASDEADWRSRPAPRDQESSGGPHKSFSFHNDPMRQGGGGGGNPRYQNREGGGQGGGGGYQRRNNYSNNNYNNNRGGDGQNAWQHSNNRSGGGGGGEYHQGDRPPRRNNYQKFEGGHQRRNEGEQREHRESGGDQEKQQPTSTPTSPPEGPSERPKLKLAPRTLPVADEPDAQASASAIFGSARPVNTAARERMIEEKLQREREAKAKADAAAAAAAAAADAEATPEAESDAPVALVAEQLPTSPPQQQQQHGGNRSHKTSVSSDHKDSAGEFHTVGSHQTHYGRGGGRGGGDRRPYKNEGPRGDRDGNRQQRLTPSESFTSGGNKYQNTRQPYHNKPRGGEHSGGGGGGGHYQQHDRVHRGHDESSSGATGQHQRSTENPWKTKSSAAADLFSGSNAGATNTVGDSPSSNRGSARTSESHPAAEQDAERSPASHQQHQRRVNTNTNNNNRLDRKPHGSGDFQNSRGGPRGDNNNRRGNYNNNNRGGGKQLGRGGERDNNKVSEKREYQPRPPRDFASVAAAPQSKQETGLNNKFAGLAIDVEDVDYDNDNDDEEEEEDEELEHEDDEQRQKEQHVDA